MNITQEQVDFLRKQHIQFALPCYAGMCYESLMTSMIKFVIYAQRIGLQFSIDTMTNESLISRARNHLVAKFLENSAATRLMFIDSDIGFDPEHIFKLILHDKDLVGGLYPKKTLPPDFVVNCNPECVDEKGQIKVIDGMIPVSRLGTGFMLIKREVFNKMMVAYPQTKFTNNIGLDPKYNPFCYALFDCAISPDTMEYLSEDWLFCARARAIGIEIFADPTIRLNHNGTFCFPGDPTALYNQMGLSIETNPQLNPKIAVRPDETKHLDSMLAIKPNLEALSNYIANASVVTANISIGKK
jgi:hypothetical protein